MSLDTSAQIYINEVIPVIDRKVRGLCKKPYHNHPKGCPNFGIKEGCPPNIRLFDEEYDMNKPVYVIFNTFDLASQVNKMKAAHPEWSDRQLKCSRYWQGTTRKLLRQKIALFKNDHPDYNVTTCPEAMGVNVTETMKKIGIKLEWPPVSTTYQVALAGIKKNLSV